MNKLCNDGLCPLIVAAKYGHIEVVEILLLEEWTGLGYFIWRLTI